MSCATLKDLSQRLHVAVYGRFVDTTIMILEPFQGPAVRVYVCIYIYVCIYLYIHTILAQGAFGSAAKLHFKCLQKKAWFRTSRAGFQDYTPGFRADRVLDTLEAQVVGAEGFQPG